MMLMMMMMAMKFLKNNFCNFVKTLVYVFELWYIVYCINVQINSLGSSQSLYYHEYIMWMMFKEPF